MKRVLFLTILPFLLLGTASVNLNAQVTIGSEQKPQSGAVLDLSQVTNQDLGFLLPRVSLENVTDWQLRGNPNNGIGMLVYNINPNTTGGNGKSGVYMWTESGWEPLKSNLADAIQVENFDLELSGATLNLEPSGATLDLYIGQTVFFTAKNFMPSDATYPGVTWIITEGVDKTSIDNSTKTMTSCSVTGLAEGRSILSATSLDENFRRTVTINVNVCTLAPAVPTGIAFSKTKGIWLGEEITATATPEVTTGGSKPTKYNWTIPTNFDITAGSGTRIITLKAKTAAESITGAIKVNAENNCGASADYSNTTALRILDCSEVPAVPTGITFSKTEGIWLGEEITATATPEVTTGGSKPTKYNWTIPANFDITAGSGTRVITLKAKSAAESITGAIKVNAENDCGASAYYSNTTALSIFDCSSIPDQPGTISGNINVTSGTIQTYEVPAVPGVRYTWSLPNGWSGSSTTNSITVTAGSSGGTISVTPVNSCGSGTARTLSVATCPGAVITNGAYSGPATSNFGSAATTMAQLTGTYGFAVSGDLCLAVKDQGSPSTYTWTNANTQCSNLNTGDQTGWRLPNIAELGNLQSTRKDYGMNQNYYWSSTGRATSTYMWRWRYNTSNAYFYDRAVLNYVRCVKSL